MPPCGRHFFKSENMLFGKVGFFPGDRSFHFMCEFLRRESSVSLYAPFFSFDVRTDFPALLVMNHESDPSPYPYT